MRATLFVLALLTVFSVVPAPASALSTCSGAWTGGAQCAFVCNDLNVYVQGGASNLGALSNLTVTADCGVAAGGVYTVLFSVTCSATGPGTATCSNSGPHLFYPLSLAGRCTVSGSASGNYACWSAP